MSALKLVVIILNQEEYLDELLEGFLEIDVRGATVIDSIGMGQIIANDIPVFGGLRSLMNGTRPYNKTIFTVVQADQVQSVVNLFEHVCGTLDNPGTGLIFTLPVDFVKGLPEQALS